jgi:ATP-dependent Lon protease
MITRSMSTNYSEIDINKSEDINDEIDEYGNIKDFIDYDMEEDPKAMEELYKLLYPSTMNINTHKPKKKKKNKKKNKNKLNDIFLNYLLLKANETVKKNRRKKKRNKIKIEESESEISSNSDIDSLVDYESCTEDNSDIELTDDEMTNDEDEDEDQDEDEYQDEDEDQDEDEYQDEDEDQDEDQDEMTNDEDQDENIESYIFKDNDKSLIQIIFDKHAKIKNNSYPLKDEEETIENIEIDSEIDSESDSEYEFDFDELDDKYNDLIDENSSINAEENDIKYFHYLETNKKEKLISDMKTIYNMNDSNVPLRFKIINSDMDMKTKAIAVGNIDKLSDMDISSGEYSKMDHWINGLIKIPFGKYKNLPVLPDSSIENKRNFINETHQKLDKAIYGHKEAKTHILQVIGKWIKNPDSGGNVLAIQGPMGNGKTTLVKEGISKVLNRPFAFIALGGASDSAFFDGHSYTYEGSHWGRIVQILQESKCMNPIIYFDELDKVSETSKGDEIIHMLTHITDPSQNSLFQDNYFPGIDLDLSKALFIFSYNDETRVNKILKDRMYVIHTKGFKTEDKLQISNEYLLPELLSTFGFKKEEIIFNNEILKEIIEKYTGGEEGVRNLKRCLETIISKINIYLLSYSEEENELIDNLSFKLDEFKFPMILTIKDVHSLLKIVDTDKPPEHMYM